MAREMELKYGADAALLERIAADWGPFSEIRMETTYFDTRDRRLGQEKCTLRCRLENGRAVYTVKIPLADGSRGEWETEAPSLGEALPLLTASGAPELPAASELMAVCGARFTRRCRTIPIPGGLAELALDQGILLGAGGEAPLLEAELELKEGPDEALRTFADSFAARYSLKEEPLSKFARARML